MYTKNRHGLSFLKLLINYDEFERKKCPRENFQRYIIRITLGKWFKSLVYVVENEFYSKNAIKTIANF